MFNPFFSNAPFLYPQKTPGFLMFSGGRERELELGIEPENSIVYTESCSARVIKAHIQV